MLTTAIGDLLPAAAAVALESDPDHRRHPDAGHPEGPDQRARRSRVGWVVGLTVVSTVVLLVSGGADDADSATSTGVDWVQLLLGLLFLVMAARQWRKRPAKGEEAVLPDVDGLGRPLHARPSPSGSGWRCRRPTRRTWR